MAVCLTAQIFLHRKHQITRFDERHLSLSADRYRVITVLKRRTRMAISSPW